MCVVGSNSRLLQNRKERKKKKKKPNGAGKMRISNKIALESPEEESQKMHEREVGSQFTRPPSGGSCTASRLI